MDETVAIRINGRPVVAPAGAMLAAVLVSAGEPARLSVSGELRGPLCAMGICFECRVTVDGIPHQRSCQIPCRLGMDVRTDE
jgi:hypothetical protein